ncbi:uncharacterized protein LOC127855251 isoform X4 [Dreissena polymorpha]|uniref:uncharacterized protein LOC127855251 isoform X4 n=1 Tax=Dreissena polymorpha TaxID=45954 RepID=UPI00226560B1|nr:uncharacterized protein LOC127855251 isoform X4 [Dreissena polymorpha]
MWNALRYNYGVREAFRYHFSEPPAAPLTHQETQRVRRIMQWDKEPPGQSPRDIRTDRDNRPKMSERTGLDYQMAPEIVRKDAPFGTESTPTITMKIIGGRQVPVIEKHATYNPEYLGSRIQPLRPIADKPNHVDPRTHGDIPGGYYTREIQPTGLNRRPDSKDVVRAQYKALPPIQLNRTRNDMSTVFESEPWTDDKHPQLASETEYKQNYFTSRGDSGNMNPNDQSSASKDHHFVSESEKNNLFMLVPRNVLLPVDPIRLTREQEVVLCKLICNDLYRFDPKELREVYVECSQHDKELRGFCGMEVLDNNLRRHKAYLSDTLRIVAAQFVDPNYPGKVNYERVLSFIGSALQLNAKGQLEKGLTPGRPEPEREYDGYGMGKDRESPHRSNSDKPKYYMENGESFKTGSIYRDREVAKLLRMVEQELSKNTYKMDWTRWQNAFHEKDRDHRETLSAAQIKDICYDQKLPLSDSLVNQILSLCEDSNRDGQYRWHNFLEFLSRVRPSNTGLPIPVSKRPLEYAKHYPAPVPNWPRTDDSTEVRYYVTNPKQRGTSPRRQSPRQDYQSPRRGQDDRGQNSPDPEQRHGNFDRSDNWNSPIPNGRTTPPVRKVRDRSPSPNIRMPDKEDRPEWFPAINDTERDWRQPRHLRRHNSERRLNDRIGQPVDGRSLSETKDRNRYQQEPVRAEEWKPHLHDIQPESRRSIADAGVDYRERRGYQDGPSGYVPSWQHRTSPPPRDRDEREGRPKSRVPSRYNRPLSYAEPQRNYDTYAPETKPRSLSPIRQETPPLRQQSPMRFRQPSPNKIMNKTKQYRDLYSGNFQDDDEERNYSQDPPSDARPLFPSPSPVPNQPKYQSQSLDTYPGRQYPYSQSNTLRRSYSYRQQPFLPASSSPNFPLLHKPNYTTPLQQSDQAYALVEERLQRYGDGYRRGPEGYADGGTSQRLTRAQQIQQLTSQLRDLETKYEITRDGMASNEQPWLDRYLKMAQALYNSDISNKGSLPRKDVLDIVEQYNNAFNLNLDISRASMLAISPDILDKSGNILLRPFLAHLSHR